MGEAVRRGARVVGCAPGERPPARPDPFRVAAFAVAPVPPFRLDLTVWTLRRRPDNVVDRWDGRRYRRVLAVDDGAVEIAVTQTAPADRPRVLVEVAATRSVPGAGSAARRAVERLLGVGTELSRFYRLADRDRRLGPVVRRFEGAKPPRFPTLFEALVNAIACQQLSLAVGIRLLNRLAEACGRPFPAGGAAARAFPGPVEVATLAPGSLRRLGFNGAKAQALLELAAAVAEGRPDLEALDSADDETVVSRLTDLRGIGRWSAEYALLRGLGRLNVFPGDDAGARNGVRRWLRLKTPPDYRQVRRVLARWEPYAGLVYFHLLLARLDEAGLVPPARGMPSQDEGDGGA